MVTLISPTSLSNGKFLGRAIPMIVTFTMFEKQFQDWETALKKVSSFSRKSTIWSNLSGTQEDSHGSASRELFLTTWPGWWLGADDHLNKDGEIKCIRPAFILKILFLRYKHNTLSVSNCL